VKTLYFQSTPEVKRYYILRIMARQSMITDLKTQPKFDIAINDIKMTTYKADFSYFDSKGRYIVEDVKPKTKFGITEVCKLKMKLVEAIYRIKITIVYGSR
jgi:hypothetical protein